MIFQMFFIIVLSFYPDHTSLACILDHHIKESITSLKLRQPAPSVFTDLLPCNCKKEVKTLYQTGVKRFFLTLLLLQCFSRNLN